MTVTEPYLAVDIGGTKLAAALVTDDGNVQVRREVPTPTGNAQPARLTRALAELAADVAGHATTLAGTGIASAGPVDTDRGTISPVNIPAWRDFDVVQAVHTAVGGPRPRLLQDSTAAALGEHWRGAGQGSRALLGVVVSTGIGGGLVMNGTPIGGSAGNAGFIGHITADPQGDPCPCGRRGCVETAASGPAMLRWAKANGWTGDSVPELAEHAKAGVTVAVAAFRRGTEVLAAGIVTAATLLDLDRVVIGGGVSAAGPVLLQPLREALAKTMAPAVANLAVVQSGLGRLSGLIGAARYAQRDY